MRSSSRILLVLALACLAPMAGAQPPPSSPAVLLLRTARSSRDRVRAAETLGATRPPGARDALERALRDRTATVRRAAVEALRQIGDAESLPALRALTRDRNREVRADVARVIAALEGMPSAPRPATASNAPVARTDWRRVRSVVRIGTLTNQARDNAEDLRTMRTTIVATLASSRDVALDDGALPAEVRARATRGIIQRYAVEGGVLSLRPGADPNLVSMRAQVNYALVAEPAHTIVGSLEGAATASEPRLVVPNAPDPVPRLVQRAIEAATQGALQTLERELAARGRRRHR